MLRPLRETRRWGRRQQDSGPVVGAAEDSNEMRVLSGGDELQGPADNDESLTLGDSEDQYSVSSPD